MAIVHVSAVSLVW